MLTYSIISMKGGVGKTVSAINIAHILAARCKARVLLIDCDKQGNASKFFGVYGDSVPGLYDILCIPEHCAVDTIQPTAYAGLSIIPASMSLLAANKIVLLDGTYPQHTRLADALEGAAYDYCIIDCAPDLNMSTINALVASDAVLIPIKLDKFAIDGMGEFLEQVDALRDYNPCLHVAGAFVTMYRKNALHTSAIEWLRGNSPVTVFTTAIRDSICVGKSTFTGEPLLIQSPNSNAARDYLSLVDELIKL